MAAVSCHPLRLVIATALLALPSATHAVQTRCEPDSGADVVVIEGTVIDRKTALPLEGAEVTVRWTDREGNDFKRDVVTDRAGEFRICDAPSDAFLAVTALWFGERSEPREVTGAGAAGRIVLEVASPHVAVSGQVHDADSGAPLAAVAVRFGTVVEQLSDENGAFRFDGIPPGLHDITAERIGFVTVRDSVPVDLGTLIDLDIRLSTQAVPLQPINVIVRSEVLQRAGFYDRESRGSGTFLTRADIERRPSVSSSDILRRVSGIRLVRGRFNNQLAIGRGNCPFRFMIDGTRILQGFSIDEIPPHWLEGIEIYNGPSTVPVQFAAGPTEPNADCGLIVLWTRNRR